MLAYTHTDEVERTCPNITPFQKHIKSVMGNVLGELFNSMFQFSGALLTWKICCTFVLPEHSSIVANNQNSDGLAINIEPIDQAELNRLEV